MGAWIEIKIRILSVLEMGRPRMGAWIEMMAASSLALPAVCRPRMGAWIEVHSILPLLLLNHVAPVWGRGLKLRS